ncbi:MAG: hypothetical protein AAF467_09040 [Actinomycetota bacterium]
MADATEDDFAFNLTPRSAAAGETPPTRAEMEVYVNAVRTMAAAGGGPEPIQHMVIDAVGEAYVGRRHDYPWRTVEPEELGEVTADRTETFRFTLFQKMSLVSLVAQEMPPDVPATLGRYAAALGLVENMAEWHAKCGGQSFDALMLDFARNGYSGGFMERSRPVLRTDADLGDGWATVEDDERLAQEWDALERCPDGSIGRTVFDFYVSRNFSFPGRPGSAPPLLAQHDWVHVLGDYGTTLENEMEVFALISSADVNPQSFSLLAMVIGLFGTGRVPSAAGLFEADRGHLDEAVSVRVAEAMARGARLHPGDDLPRALLEVDWFALSDQPLADVQARFGIEPKTGRATAAGSVGPWEEAGFSAYQIEHGDLSLISRYS